jgi:HEAT repeat protein
LKEIGRPAVTYLIQALLWTLQNADRALEDKIIKVLGKIGESAKAATEPLIKILETTCEKDDPNCNLLEPVLIALALIKDPEAVGPLIKAIKYNTAAGDPDYAVQNWIIFALGDIGDKLATEPLIQLMLRNSESRIRGIAAAALGKIGDNKAIEPLISVLENKKDNSWVRDNAAWALLQMDEGKTALPLLKYLKWNHKSIFDSLKGFQFPSEFKNMTSEG